MSTEVTDEARQGGNRLPVFSFFNSLFKSSRDNIITWWGVGGSVGHPHARSGGGLLVLQQLVLPADSSVSQEELHHPADLCGPCGPWPPPVFLIIVIILQEHGFPCLQSQVFHVECRRSVVALLFCLPPLNIELVGILIFAVFSNLMHDTKRSKSPPPPAVVGSVGEST